MNKVRLLISNIYRFFYPISKVEMYKRMGVEIGTGCKFQFDVVIDYAHYWLINIGNNVTLAPRVHVLAHDASTKNHLGYTRISKVVINDNVFVGAGAIILPGVEIGENSIIGAGSVVSKNIPPNVVAAGNPAKVICGLDEYLSKQKDLMKDAPVYDYQFTLPYMNPSKIAQMKKDLENGAGFVE
jgi:maltose O-acetyltransferase